MMKFCFNIALHVTMLYNTDKCMFLQIKTTNYHIISRENSKKTFPDTSLTE